MTHVIEQKLGDFQTTFSWWLICLCDLQDMDNYLNLNLNFHWEKCFSHGKPPITNGIPQHFSLFEYP